MKTEIEADLRAEMAMLGWLAAAVACAFFGPHLLLLALVFALAKAGPLSVGAAALWVAGALTVIVIGAGLIEWSKALPEPLAKRHESFPEDLP